LGYGGLLADPRPWVDAINAVFGGWLNTDAMVGVVDASLWRSPDR
jgi:hypothetical protein